jgi:hypothetical protein
MQKKIQITDQFNFDYFTSRTNARHQFSVVQRFMMRQWHEEFKKVLKLFPKNQFYKDIGILLPEDRRLYDVEGRNIPETIDLSFGLPVRLNKPDNKQLYGEWFTHGVGGVQLYTEGAQPLADVFKSLAKRIYGQKLQFGDLYYTSGGKLKLPVLSIGNSKYLLYREYFTSKYLPTPQFWYSTNGGYTLKRYLQYAM